MPPKAEMTVEAAVPPHTTTAPRRPRPSSWSRRALRRASAVLPPRGALAVEGCAGSLVAVQTAAPVIALTFDDGPAPDHTRPILDVLDAHGARATFFVLARRAEQWPELVREVRARGHEVALHGDEHTRLGTGSVADVHACVVQGRRRLERVLGAPVRLFRPPYGSLSPYAYAVARAQRMQVVLWSANSRDSRPAPVDQLVRNSLETLAPGGIVLLHERLEHDGGPAADVELDRAGLVDRLLVATAARGWRSETVSELLAMGTPSRVVRFLR